MYDHGEAAWSMTPASRNRFSQARCATMRPKSTDSDDIESSQSRTSPAPESSPGPQGFGIPPPLASFQPT